MFTGLIEDIGTIKKIDSSKLSIETSLKDIKIGDSIAVNGVCLTAVSLDGGGFTADYSPQTDKVTTLSSLKSGSKVNLERALQLSSRLGGHIVSGHVDGIAKIKKIEKKGSFFHISFFCAKEILHYCVNKGSVAIDGISLTIADVFNDGFDVFIIPETINNTILKFKKAGDEVNIETDILGKYVEKFTGKKDNAITLDMLKGNGFI